MNEAGQGERWYFVLALLRNAVLTSRKCDDHIRADDDFRRFGSWTGWTRVDVVEAVIHT
jgi:hypothetical protein